MNILTGIRNIFRNSSSEWCFCAGAVAGMLCPLAAPAGAVFLKSGQAFCYLAGQKLETLKKLIFDEIDAREFFLYVNSENAATSKWVQEELEYIRSTRPQRMISIDLNESDGEIANKLFRLIRGMRVFISASARDRELVNRLTNTLNAHDFRVYDADASISVGELWSNSLSRNFESLAKEGCVIALLTESSLKSQFVRYELEAAVEKNVPILPVLVGETSAILCTEQLPMLRRLQLLTVSS